MKNPTFATLAAMMLVPLISWAQPTASSLNSGLRLTASSTGDFAAKWFGLDGHVYFLELSADLVEWSWVPIYEIGDDDALEYGFSTNADRLFLRLQFSDDPESELLSSIYNQGGISAWNQVQLGYNPFEWVDSTSNGMHDAWEMYYFGTTGIDPDEDVTGSGLTNREEFQLGTDPLSSDSNQNGIWDGIEFRLGMNPADRSYSASGLAPQIVLYAPVSADPID
jgi:hypothetical protein